MKKKIITIMLGTLLVFSAMIFSAAELTAAEVPEIQGGSIRYDFSTEEQLSDFSLYTEFEKDPYLLDGRLQFWTLAEQKAINETGTYSDVEVEAEFSTLNDNGKYDCGIYVQASDVTDKMDGATGWCVNIEHGADELTYKVKLHRFQEGRWEGDKVAVSGLRFKSDSIRLRVKVLSGMLYAYTDARTNPLFEYEIGPAEGKVGIRCYYSPNNVKYFSVTSPKIKTDLTSLRELTEEARKCDLTKYTSESVAAFTEAMNKAEEMLAEEKVGSQKDADMCENTLREAMADLTYKRAFDELTDTILRAQSLKDSAEKYTANTYGSVKRVMEKCMELTEENSEQEISYWCNALQKRLENLVEYGEGGTL